MKNNLNLLFSPKSVAIIGASRDVSSVGHGIAKNLLAGCVLQCKFCRPFGGKTYLINPHANDILGQNCYASILDVKGSVDVAIIAVPAKIVPAVMHECAKKKVKFAIVISAGFSEAGEEGIKLSDGIVSIAKSAGIRILGPNCLGIIRPNVHLNASFAPSVPSIGSVAFISQSGALADSVIDWAIDERFGFSGIVSIGNAADIGFSELLDWFSQDRETKVITLYIEGIKDGRRFFEHLTRACRKKPVVVLKAGSTDISTRAIGSHTASLAGNFQVFSAAISQAGAFQVNTVEDLFDVAKALSLQPKMKSNRIAIVTNAGGPGVMCSDWCSKLGLDIVELKESTKIKLEKTKIMHHAYSRANPLDLIGDALPRQYEAAINILLSEKYIDGLIMIQTIQTMTKSEDDAKVIISARKRFPNKPIVCMYMGGRFSKRAINILEEAGIPDFNDPRKAALAMRALAMKAL